MHAQSASPAAQWVAQNFPPNAPSQNGYVSVGNLHVSAAVYPQFRQSVAHLAAEPDTARLLSSVATAPAPTVIDYAPSSSGSNYAAPFAATDASGVVRQASAIKWDPASVVVDTHGYAHSAAIVLGHELGHAEAQVRDPAGIAARVAATRADGYTNAEEHRVVTGWETSASRAVGEPVRPGHSVNGVLPGVSVTSPEAALNVYEPQPNGGVTTHRMPSNYQQSGPIVAVDATHVYQDVGRGHQVAYDRSALQMFVPEGGRPLTRGDHLDVVRHGAQLQVDSRDLAQSQTLGQPNVHQAPAPAAQPFGVGR